jgi:hypothetical protein
MSPSAMNEQERRELIARQHRALYGDNASLYSSDGSRPVSQDARVLAAGSHGATPLNFDNFGAPPAGSSDSTAPGTQENPTNIKSPNPATTFAMFDASQPPTGTSTSSPGGEGVAVSSGIGPIGSRPAQVAGLKRNSPPAGSSPLSFGFANDKSAERSTSAASNPAALGNDGKPGGLGWGAANNGPWGAKQPMMGAQQSVWG